MTEGTMNACRDDETGKKSGRVLWAVNNEA